MKYYPWDEKLSRGHFLPCYASIVVVVVVVVVVCSHALYNLSHVSVCRYDQICVPHFDVIDMSEDKIRTRGNRFKLFPNHYHYDVMEAEEPRCPTVSNFIEIDPTVCEISCFFSIFQDGGHRHLGFLNF